VSVLRVRTEDLGKRYQTGERQPYGSLRDSIATGARRLLSRPRSAESRSGDHDYIWALRNVSIEARESEVIGIIGDNGAGKSTLLKILSRITEPTEGSATIWGLTGTLMEVGTGFHPELTGRENIALNGSILGMRRSEVRQHFDAIVEFAEVERFLDTPVKHYSSGMYVRLAFAIAAHLEMEIMMVDEVLAVGDATFQRKCLGRMEEVASAGRTVFFVSHNMTAVNQLCTRALWVNHGKVEMDGPTDEVVATYLQRSSSESGERRWDGHERAPGNDNVRFSAVRVRSSGKTMSEPPIDKEIDVEVDFELLRPAGKALAVSIDLLDAYGNMVLSSANAPGASIAEDLWFGEAHEPGRYRSVCTFPANLLNDDRYYVTVHLMRIDDGTAEATAAQAVSFTGFDTGKMREGGRVGVKWPGFVRPRLGWRTEAVEGEFQDEAMERRAPSRIIRA
jgi:lipopolysaccharide transport system ATP-binding protein